MKNSKKSKIMIVQDEGIKTKGKFWNIIGEILGIEPEKIADMGQEEIEEEIKKKTGKNVQWRKDMRVDCYPIITPEEFKEKMDKMIEKIKEENNENTK